MIESSIELHPIWYQKSRPFVKHARRVISVNGLVQSSLQSIQQEIQTQWNNALVNNAVDADDVLTDPLKEVSLAVYYSKVATSGFNVFLFEDTVGDMLLNSSADDIPVELIKSPYSSYYIHFHREFTVGTRSLIGAYIIDDPQISVLQVCLLFAPMECKAHWLSSPSSYIFLPINRDGGSTLGEAIEDAVVSEIAEKQRVASEAMPQGFDVDRRQERLRRETKELIDAKDTLNEVMSYISNCLCFLTSSGDVTWDYPLDTPSSLVDKVKTAKDTRGKEKNLSKMRSMGYTPIQVMGKAASQAMPRVEGNDSDSLKKAHWRRGHWRNQKHGTRHQLSKLLWIKPTLVGAESIDDSEARQYRVK